ncbi:uncharacterized protein LOC116805117 [Drosophila grimshawi]|uniref:uncharacterized protein LOC116805117 n=1 Tax=Drosophila grimshawi TaxID=7222 RepID=UPI001C935951|nr:uncharacterized protein LOC116805117 [Drosophila grimshawi]
MILQRISIMFGIITLIGITKIYAEVEFNNIKCLARDPNFINFEMCAFRSVNRSYKYMSIRAQIYELPITYALITFKLSKRDNQHVFERFNSSVELCRFMRDRQNPVASFLFSVFEDYATFNHTCPFTESHYILEKLPVQHITASKVKSWCI